MDAGRRVADLRRRWTAPYLLELDLTQPMLEERPPGPVGRLQSRRRAVLPDVLRALSDAATDPRVCGLIAKVGAARMGFAQAQDVRSAVAAFRAAGKPAVAWSETFGELGVATVPYYVAAAFGEIWLQPSGELGLVGVSAGSLFLAEALDRIGVKRQFGTRYEYKSAANIFLERSFTDPQREATSRIVDSLFEQVVDGVAQGRQLGQDVVRDLVDRPHLALTRPRRQGSSTTSGTGTRCTRTPSERPIPTRSCCSFTAIGASSPSPSGSEGLSTTAGTSWPW